MSTSGVKIVAGAAVMGPSPRPFSTVAQVHEIFDILKRHNVTILDTAQLTSRLYEGSEELLGEAGVTDPKWGFTIDSKALGGWRLGSSTREGILQGARETLRKLGLKGGNEGKLDVFYIHAPDKDVPFPETCAGINDAHKEGLFERFGLSNFRPEEVQSVYDICKKNGFVLPTVYQGNYSPVARKQEEILFPLLRKLGIAFYAYSPIAGGFLTKTKEDIANGKGRFNENIPIGKLYRTLYAKPSYLEALSEWDSIAKDAGVGKAELAYRWVVYNSHLKQESGDACIVGYTRKEQLENTLKFVEKGPLDAKTCQRIDQVWKTIEHEAGVDNFILNG